MTMDDGEQKGRRSGPPYPPQENSEPEENAVSENHFDASGENAQAEDESAQLDHQGVEAISSLPAKKKKKRKPKSQRGLGKPTGFEEYYVDAPLTPDQHAEEQKLYDPSLPFFNRILTAIQRFRQHRRLSPERTTVLDRYLSYGNVDVSPNMFQSFSPDDPSAEGMDKEQLAAVAAQISLSADKRDIGTESSKYEVDFTGCVRGFLSRRAGEWFGMETKEGTKVVTGTIERFLNYLLQHQVCPDFTSDILAARDVCRLGSRELWAIAEAQRQLPGDFNIACSTLFGGEYSVYDGQTYWGPEVQGEKHFVGLSEETATQIIKFGVAGAATEEVYEEYYPKAMDNSLHVIEVRDAAGFEIISIESPSDECREMFKNESTDFQPVGIVYAKPWQNPDTPPEDLTKEERELMSKNSILASEEPEDLYVFFVEEALQKHLFVGMKVTATIHRLNCGIWFFDRVLRAYCSFDLWLANEMMLEWKEPRALPGAADYKEVEHAMSETDGDKEATPVLAEEIADISKEAEEDEI